MCGFVHTVTEPDPNYFDARWFEVLLMNNQIKSTLMAVSDLLLNFCGNGSAE